MMGFKDPPQEKLFCVKVSLDKRVRRNHPLRQEKLDRMRAISHAARARQDLKLRQFASVENVALREGNAWAWRGCAGGPPRRMASEDSRVLTAAIQNIAVLVRYARSPHPIALTVQAMSSDSAMFTWQGRFDVIFGSETCL